MTRAIGIDPPRTFAGYDYLGTFETTGDLSVSDPGYIGRGEESKWLFTPVNGAPGVWHTYLSGGRTLTEDSELVAIHEAGFDVVAREELGHIGVDSGHAGIYDPTCPSVDLNAPIVEGPVGGKGVVVSSGGDGMYPVLAGRLANLVVKLRVVFRSTLPTADRLVSAITATADMRPYKASAHFEVGDTIDHAKFGIGRVLLATSEGKIDVQFSDELRTLVHAKK